MVDQGWIKLYRSLLDDEIWNIEQPKCYGAAWVDLILLANHKHNTVYEEPVSRGQHKTSLSKLSNRWHWRFEKVKKFLDMLVNDGKITVDYRPTNILITISNYDKFQTLPKGSGKGSGSGRTDGSGKGSGSGRQTRMIENDIKNDKEEKASPSNFNGVERE